MGLASRLVPTDHRPEVLVAALLGATVLGSVAFVLGLLLVALSATGVVAPDAGPWVLLGLVALVLAAGAVAAASVGGLAWLALAGLRTGVAAGWRKLLWAGYTRARRLEEASPLGRLLRPADVFASRADRDGPLVDELQSRYVAGELDELAFERELERLLGGDRAVTHARREVAGRTGDRRAGDDAAGDEDADAERDPADDAREGDREPEPA